MIVNILLYNTIIWNIESKQGHCNQELFYWQQKCILKEYNYFKKLSLWIKNFCLQGKYLVCTSKMFSLWIKNFSLWLPVSFVTVSHWNFLFNGRFFTFTINKLQQCCCQMYFLITVRKESLSAHVVCEIKTQSCSNDKKKNPFISTLASCVEVRLSVVYSGGLTSQQVCCCTFTSYTLLSDLKLHQSRSACCHSGGSRACSVRWAWSQLRGTRRGACCHQHLVAPVITPRYFTFFVLNVEDSGHLPVVSPAAFGR